MFIDADPDQRLFVMGDIHGDLGVLLCALHDCAGVLGPDLCWQPGNSSWVVLCGDMVDRSRPGVTQSPQSEIKHEEVLIQLYLNKLDKQATKHGGRIFKIIGNHELMNLVGDSNQYVSRVAMESRLTYQLARGSEFARVLYTDNAYMMLQIGKWLFMHAGIGGVTQENFGLLAHTNRAARQLFCEPDGRPTSNPDAIGFLLSGNGIAWDRTFGTECDPYVVQEKFKLVERVTGRPIDKMAIGHTTQEMNDMPAYVHTHRMTGGQSPIPYNPDKLMPLYKAALVYDKIERAERADDLSGPLQLKKGPKGISGGCNSRVWRVDAAMSRAFGFDCPESRAPQVLEALADGTVLGVRRLKPNLWTKQARMTACLPPWMSLDTLAGMLFSD